MTSAIAMNIEAMFQAAGHILKSVGMGLWSFSDHVGLRPWQANHQSPNKRILTPEQSASMG
eukprot:4674071-Lingulodinium_polyedra.AAC.1